MIDDITNEINPDYKERFKELLGQFGFLDDLIKSTEYPITNIRVERDRPAPTGSALDFHYDSGYEYWTNVHEFGGTTVHEYVTDAPPKKGPDCELVIYQ